MKYIIIQPLAGGFALGAEKAIGHKPEFIISHEAFSFNDSFLTDYWKDIPYSYIKKDDNYESSGIDLVISVPVCAGLSQLNSSKQRGSDAPQNENMLINTKFALENIKPKVYMFENAPGLFSSVGEGVVEKLKEIAKKNNYSLTLYKTDTLLHGVPQRRRRTFAIFWKDSDCPIMEYENKRVKLLDYLDEIPKDAAYNDIEIDPDLMNNEIFDYLKDKNLVGDAVEGLSLMTILDKYELIEDYIKIAKDEKLKKQAVKAFTKLSAGKNYWDHSPYFLNRDFIGAVQGRLYGRTIHPTKFRDLTARELIWLMGHPHDFMLKDNPRKYIHVIGQNVPVNTAKFITSQAIKFIDGKLPSSHETFVKQDNVTNTSQKVYTIEDLF